MNEYLRQQVDWPQAFPPEEYEARIDSVRKSLVKDGLDAIYVTIPADITYLTGFDIVWNHLRSLIGVLVSAGSERPLFFDGPSHRNTVSAVPEIRDVVWMPGPAVESNVQAIADTIVGRGLARGKRIALQPWSYSPHASVIEQLADSLRAAGAEIADGSMLVEQIRLVKSPREVEIVYKAAGMADRAMTAVMSVIRPGVMETEIEAAAMNSLMREGGGYPGIRSMIGSGPRSGVHHTAPTHRKLRQGDLMFVDFSAVYFRYHVNINRTFSLGEPDPRWADIMDKSAASVDAVVDAVKPGDPLSKVQHVADDYIDEVGLREHVWFIGGYSTGISPPPDWCGNHWLTPREGVGDRILEPGMLFNYENQFDVDGWPGGTGARYIDSFLVNEDGLEVLSRLPRNIIVV